MRPVSPGRAAVQDTDTDHGRLYGARAVPGPPEYDSTAQMRRRQIVAQGHLRTLRPLVSNGSLTTDSGSVIPRLRMDSSTLSPSTQICDTQIQHLVTR